MLRKAICSLVLKDQYDKPNRWVSYFSSTSCSLCNHAAAHKPCFIYSACFVFLMLFCLMQSSTISTFCHSTLILSLYMSVGFFFIDVYRALLIEAGELHPKILLKLTMFWTDLCFNLKKKLNKKKQQKKTWEWPYSHIKFMRCIFVRRMIVKKMNGEQLSVDALKNEYVSLDFLICRMFSSWLDMFETFGSSPCQHIQSHWLKKMAITENPPCTI